MKGTRQRKFNYYRVVEVWEDGQWNAVAFYDATSTGYLRDANDVKEIRSDVRSYREENILVRVVTASTPNDGRDVNGFCEYKRLRIGRA